jgi:phosphoesterase RecJ-like protein
MSMRTAARARRRAIRLIERSSEIYLGTHVRPDGDALGSLLGLGLALEKAGHRVAALCADPVPASFTFLPGADRIRADAPSWRAALGIVVDCDGLSRVGALEPVFASLPALIDIDHHGTDQAFGQERLVDPAAGATAEIVYDLLQEMDIPLDVDISTCLYTGVLTDTGRFCYGNTTSTSLRVAAELLAGGADAHLVARKVYEERSVAATHLLGLALTRLSPALGGQVVSSVLRREDFGKTGASPSDTEGIIDHLRAIGGPRVAILFVQPDDDYVRVSLRSDGSVDVSKIALGFGGGGHAMAAGCTVDGTAKTVEKEVLEAIRIALDRLDQQDAG